MLLNRRGYNQTDQELRSGVLLEMEAVGIPEISQREKGVKRE